MASKIWTAAFWKGAGERALKSFVQGGLYGLGLGALVDGSTPNSLPNIVDVPWLSALSAAVIMAILSVATSIVNADFTAGPEADASVVALATVPRHATAVPDVDAVEDETEFDESEIPDEVGAPVGRVTGASTGPESPDAPVNPKEQ